MAEHRPYDVRLSLGEEIANSVSHGVGAVLSLTGLAFLLVLAYRSGGTLALAACWIYGISLFLLYFSSTLYHALTHRTAKRVFRILDHSAIYLLIAGTYTPFALIVLGGLVGWSIFGVVWGLAVAGVVFKCFLTGRLTMLSSVTYVAMGWLGLFVAKPLWDVMSLAGFLWLLAGGLLYTSGLAFFASERRYAHTVWHLFVLAGSTCHYIAVYQTLRQGS